MMARYLVYTSVKGGYSIHGNFGPNTSTTTVSAPGSGQSLRHSAGYGHDAVLHVGIPHVPRTTFWFRI